MNTAVINIKQTKVFKTKIQKIANELGISVSALINGYLSSRLPDLKKVIFTIDEKPSKYLIESNSTGKKKREKRGENLLLFLTCKKMPSNGLIYSHENTT